MHLLIILGVIGAGAGYYLSNKIPTGAGTAPASPMTSALLGAAVGVAIGWLIEKK